MRERWATFDCYGTLVDWRAGIRSVLSGLWPDADADGLLAAYHRAEPLVQAGRGISYRRVMAETMALVAETAGSSVPPREEDALAVALPTWPVFPEVPEALTALRDAGWRLAILSNTDPDLLDASIDSIGVPVDRCVVASAIGSYKPAVGHWETFFRESGADRSRHVHVAASLFHDIEPCAALGLPAVWINRLAEMSAVPRAAELPDLVELPATLERLVSA